MGLQGHVSGSLKQTNKKHKGERKRCDSTKILSRTRQSGKNLSKKARKLQAKQQRIVKNKMITSGQKSANIPLMCLLLPLHENIDLNLAQKLLSKGDPASSSRIGQINDLTSSHRSYEVNYLHCPLIKKEFSLVNGVFNDFMVNLDLARLADCIIFVLPGDMSKFDPEHYSEMLTMLYSQGLPSSTFCVMSNLSDTKELLSLLEAKFPVSDGKVRTLNSTGDAFNLLRFLSQSQKKPSFSLANNYLSTPNALKVGTTSTRLRCGMLVEAISTSPNDENINEVYLTLEGLLRGWDLPLYDISQSFTASGEEAQLSGCPFVHLTGWGDFPLRSASWTEHLAGGFKIHQAEPVPIVWKAVSGPDAALTDTLSAIWEDMQLSEADDDVSEKSGDDSDEEMLEEDEEEEEVEVGDIPPDSDGETNNDLDIDENASQTTSKVASVSFKRETTIQKIPAKQITSAVDKIKAAKVELQFPDEVETPQDMSARDRFIKYRGLPSFSKCTWPTENDTSLPYEYGKIFRFGNYAHNRRTLIKHTLRQLRHLALEPQKNRSEQSSSLAHQLHRRIPSGSVASLTLGPLPSNLASALVAMTTATDGTAKPLTLWSLLPYERCLTVLHATMQKRVLSAVDGITESGDDQFDPDPLMAKEPMLYQVGIRRFKAAPIYSQANKAANTNSKMEKFFTLATSPIVATMYAPVCYAPQAVLQFRIHPVEGGQQFALGDLVATGSLLACDPTRAIVKRVLLSGHPYKIHKRGAVVRYMFHTPEDVEYFKPIQLHTKCGAVGHIKQSVGTHGLMKCLFDRPIKAHDVILLPLYKRVFPKMTYDSCVYGRLININPAGEVRQEKQQTATSRPMSQGILKAQHDVIRTLRQETGQEMKFAMLTPDEEALFH